MKGLIFDLDAHHNSNGNVLDEWACSFQSTNPFPKAETGEGK